MVNNFNINNVIWLRRMSFPILQETRRLGYKVYDGIGIQSGTWIMLPWWKEGVRSTTRESSLMFISEPLRKTLQLDFDSETHSWMYAGLRGFISTLPVGGLGLIYEPLCREIGSHFNHTVTALLMGACYGLNIYGITFLWT